MSSEEFVYTFAELGVLHSYPRPRNGGHQWQWVIPAFKPREFQSAMQQYQDAVGADAKRDAARVISHLTYWFSLRHFQHHFLVRYNTKDSNFSGAEWFDGWQGFDTGKQSAEELAEEVARRVLKNLDNLRLERAWSFYAFYQTVLFSVRKTTETATIKERGKRSPLEIEGTANEDGEIGDNFQNPEIAKFEAHQSADFRFLHKYFDVLTCDEKMVLEYLQTGTRGERMSYAEIADTLTRDSVYARAYKSGKVRLWTEAGVKKVMSRLRQRLRKAVEENEAAKDAKLLTMRKPMSQKIGVAA